MGIKRMIGKVARQRLFSVHGVPRISRGGGLATLRKEAVRRAPSPLRRRPKLMGIPPTKVR